MRMEFLDVSEGGIYPNCSPKTLIRLSGFTDSEKLQFIKSIQQIVLDQNKQLKLHELSFMQVVNCSVTFKLSLQNEGLNETDPGKNYMCLLTRSAYQEMVEIIKHVEDGYNWLTPGEYLDEPAFLISKWGPW